MSVKITLMIYSGRENPSWNLNDTQVDELKQRLGGIRSTTMERPSGVLGGLGYTGFLIEAEREADIEPQIYVHENICDLGPSNACIRDSGNGLERFLLASADQSMVGSGLNQYVASTFQPDGTAYAGRYGRAAPRRVRGLEVPRYEPNVWNADDNIRLHNNCYNYANNRITNSFAQPGRGSGQVWRYIDADEISQCAVRDGLEGLQSGSEEWQSTPIEGHWVAMVIWPPSANDPEGSGDYHWYRLDDENARFSHKPGQTAARDVDAANAQISDPRQADRGPYTIFGGFFHAFPGRSSIS